MSTSTEPRILREMQNRLTNTQGISDLALIFKKAIHSRTKKKKILNLPYNTGGFYDVDDTFNCLGNLSTVT